MSVLLQGCNCGLNVLSSACAAVMLSEKKMKKDREIVLELETQIKGRRTQRILLQSLVAYCLYDRVSNVACSDLCSTRIRHCTVCFVSVLLNLFTFGITAQQFLS